MKYFTFEGDQAVDLDDDGTITVCLRDYLTEKIEASIQFKTQKVWMTPDKRAFLADLGDNRYAAVFNAKMRVFPCEDKITGFYAPLCEGGNGHMPFAETETEIYYLEDYDGLEFVLVYEIGDMVTGYREYLSPSVDPTSLEWASTENPHYDFERRLSDHLLAKYDSRELPYRTVDYEKIAYQ